MVGLPWFGRLVGALTVVLLVAGFCGAQSPPAPTPPAPTPPAGGGKLGKPRLNLLEGLGPQFSKRSVEGDALFTARYRLEPGAARGRLWITAKITPGWHLFSTTQPVGGPQATKISLVAPSGGKVGELRPDKDPHVVPSDVFPVPEEQHEGEVTWDGPLELPAGFDPHSGAVELKISGQICEKACIPIAAQVSAKYDGELAPAANPGEHQPQASQVILRGAISPAVAAPGSRVKLTLSASPAAGWHIYERHSTPREASGSRPTLIAVTSTGGGKVLSITPDRAAEPAHDPASGELPGYGSPVTWTVEIALPRTLPLGETRLVGFAGFQTCKEGTCTPPEGVKFSVPLTIAAREQPGEAGLEFEAADYGAAVTAVNSLPHDDGPQSLWAAIGLSLVGGFLLNLMPCVLPVLGLKMLSFVKQAGQSRARMLALNFSYALGLLAVMMVMATLAAFLNLGWGEHFGQLWFKVTMLIVTFGMGLSFLGVWEVALPGFSGDGADKLQGEGLAGAFFKGVFTTILGVSCSAPFLGPVFGYTLTQPPLVTYVIFACIALGMASPFLLIALAPGMQRLIPKPGDWMDTFKHVMGFVMMGVAIFLLAAIEPKWYIALLTLLVGVGFACWVIGRVPIYEPLGKQLTAWAFGGAVAGVIGAASFMVLGPQIERFEWRDYSPESLAQAQAEGKTVMLDFTATWCYNCHWNMYWAINTRRVARVVEENGVVAMKADWTNGSAEVTAKLNELQSRSIPVLAIYPPGNPNQPLVLRDLVTESQVLEALSKAGKSQLVNTPASDEGSATASSAPPPPTGPAG